MVSSDRESVHSLLILTRNISLTQNWPAGLLSRPETRRKCVQLKPIPKSSNYKVIPNVGRTAQILKLNAEILSILYNSSLLTGKRYQKYIYLFISICLCIDFVTQRQLTNAKLWCLGRGKYAMSKAHLGPVWSTHLGPIWVWVGRMGKPSWPPTVNHMNTVSSLVIPLSLRDVCVIYFFTDELVLWDWDCISMLIFMCTLFLFTV